MYDLEALRRLNEQATERFIELANENRSTKARVAVKPEDVKPLPVFPLSILAKKLMGGPPSLAYFMQLLESSDSFVAFRGLVREYLPDYEVNIMAEDLTRRAYRFCELFSRKYFLLGDYAMSEDFGIGDLVERIPTQPMGFSSSTYHNFQSLRPGYVIALSLVETPWEEDLEGMDFDGEFDGEGNGRVPILEMVQGIVGEGLVRLMPEKGWDTETLHHLTDGTEFDGLGLFADWVWCNTGLYHLDTQGESLEMGSPIEWNPESVKEMTKDWNNSVEIMDKIHRVALLLEQDSERTFRRLIALLLDNKNLIIPKEQLELPLK